MSRPTPSEICKSKKHFTSALSALAYILEFDQAMNHYKCDHCDGWHLTTCESRKYKEVDRKLARLRDKCDLLERENQYLKNRVLELCVAESEAGE